MFFAVLCVRPRSPPPWRIVIIILIIIIIILIILNILIITLLLMVGRDGMQDGGPAEEPFDVVFALHVLVTAQPKI